MLDLSCDDAFTMPLLSLWAMLILFPHSSSFPASDPNLNSVFCHKSNYVVSLPTLEQRQYFTTAPCLICCDPQSVPMCGPKQQEDLFLLAEFRCYCKNAMKALHEERVAELHSVFLLCHHICLETAPMKHHGKLPARLLLSHLIMSIYCPRLTLSTWITS